MKNIKIIILWLSVIIFCLSVTYGLWQIGKIINYNLSYKDMVIKTIKENVREECLK